MANLNDTIELSEDENADNSFNQQTECHSNTECRLKRSFAFHVDNCNLFVIFCNIILYYNCNIFFTIHDFALKHEY